MAHKKGAGSTKNGRDSNPQKLGVKRFAGQWVVPGQVLVRQRGATFQHSLPHTYAGRDFTIHATKPGFLSFKGRRIQVTTPTAVRSDLMLQLARVWALD